MIRCSFGLALLFCAAPILAQDADADYRAALGRLAVELPGPLLAAGYSFGAAAALRCSAGDAGVSALLLVAP